MYQLNPITKKSIEETIFESALILSSIPQELLTPEMKEKVDKAIFNCGRYHQFLYDLKEQEVGKQEEVTDMREFHQMD